MKKIQLGNSTTRVSQMALGCLPFGSKLDKAQSWEILDYYFSRGGAFLDTSNNYAFWENGCTGRESETLLGQWFKEKKNRDKIFLATKVGAFPPDKQQLLDNINAPGAWTKYTEGLSRKVIIEGAEGSLKRLNTDYIDLYYAHVDHRAYPLEETLEAFDSLVKSGKVRHIGCSNYKTWRMVQAKNISRNNHWAEYAAIQQFHTYFKTEKEVDPGIGADASEELFDYIRDNRDITVLGYTPLLWGSYSRPEKYEEIPKLKFFKSAANTVRAGVLEKTAKEVNATVNQVIYAWMMQSDPAVIPLVAVSRMEHLKEDLDAVHITLSAGQLDLLNNPFFRE